MCENCIRILEEEKHRQLHIFIILWQKGKETNISSINENVKSQNKQCIHPRILLLWHQHQFTVVLNNWTFRRHHWNVFCIKTFVWRHTKFNWFQCVFTSLSGPAIDLQKMPILAKKKSSFQMKLILILASTYVNKQNCRIWGTENP